MTDALLENNREHVETFGTPLPDGLPSMRVAVLACMDARMDPYAILGLSPGHANVLRNAGGLVTDDAIRSLAISQQMLGTDEVVVLQHTDCGLQKFSDEEFDERLEAIAGERPPWRAQTFGDLEKSVRDSIRRLDESPFLRHRSARGFVYDVLTGRLSEVNSP